MNQTLVSRIRYQFHENTMNSLSVSQSIFLNLLFCEFTMNIFSFSQINFKFTFGFTIFLENIFGIHYLLGEFTLNSLWIHFLFREFTMYFANISRIYFLFREFTVDLLFYIVNLLWIFFLFFVFWIQYSLYFWSNWMHSFYLLFPD